jgi:hypothetical protein
VHESLEHLPNMDHSVQRVLIMQCRSLADDDIAEHDSVSVATVRRRAAKGMSEIFDTLPVPLRRNSRSAGYWVACHQSCCLANAARAIDGVRSTAR